MRMEDTVVLVDSDVVEAGFIQCSYTAAPHAIIVENRGQHSAVVRLCGSINRSDATRMLTSHIGEHKIIEPGESDMFDVSGGVSAFDTVWIEAKQVDGPTELFVVVARQVA
jgi:hypothetical protein